MPVYIGGTEIKKMYKGGTEIAEVHKGSQKIHSGSFDPLSLNPISWHDAKDSNYKVLNGSYVSQLTDKTANGYDLIQPNAALQPLNNANGIYFLQNSRRMYNTTLAAKILSYSNYTIIFVFDSVNSAIRHNVVNFNVDGAKPYNRLCMLAWNAYPIRVFHGNGISYQAFQTSNVVNRALPAIYGCRVPKGGGAKTANYRNRDESRQQTTSLTIATSQVRFGIGGATYNKPRGYFKEVLTFGRQLSNADYALIEDYLALKHNI